MPPRLALYRQRAAPRSGWIQEVEEVEPSRHARRRSDEHDARPLSVVRHEPPVEEGVIRRAWRLARVVANGWASGCERCTRRRVRRQARRGGFESIAAGGCREHDDKNVCEMPHNVSWFRDGRSVNDRATVALPPRACSSATQ